ncbi:MAG: gliding motility-associated C-terminal domain-containing protein [Cyclobacteriaceae bacterium]
MKRYLYSILFTIISLSATAQDWNFGLTPVNEKCKGAGNGSIDITMTGNLTNRTFTWTIYKKSDLVNPESTGTVGALNPDIQALDTTTYVVFVSRNGTAEERNKEAVVGGSDTDLVVSKTVLSQNLCNGGNAGKIEVTATGGSGFYEYGLSNEMGSTGPSSSFNYSDNGGIFEGLAQGTYRAWVRDSFGCEKGNTSGDFAITEPEEIKITFDTTNADCNNAGGQIDLLSISGGTPFDPGTAGPFNYNVEWSDDQGNELSDFDNKASLTGLDSGQYSVIITDKNGCNGSSQFQLSKGFLLEINDRQNVSCAFENDGRLQVKLGSDSENDEAPFELRLYDGDNDEITAQLKTNIPKDSLVVFSGLGADAYRIEVLASTGCKLNLYDTLTQPDAPKLDNATMSPVVCKTESSGSITFEVSGGSGSGYQYSVDGGTTYSSNPLISGLAAGTYDMWIKDDSDCAVDVADTEVTEPSRQWALEQVASNDISCNGANDGLFTWRFDPNFDTDPIVDDEDIKWIDRNTDEVIATGLFSKTDLVEGDYRLDVTANSGCYRSLTFSISEPAALQISGDAPVFNCPESLSSTATDIFAEVSGGTQPYTFSWKKNGGALGSETTSDNATNTTLQGIGDNTTYTLFVTDANDCELSKAFNVVIPEEIEIEIVTQTNVACKGESTGAIDITVTGGTQNSGGSYNFNWSKDGNADFSFEEDLTDLAAGEYKISVLDNNSCGPVEATVIITEPSTSYSLSGEVTPVICNGEASGTIDVTIDRGTSPNIHPNPTSIEWTKDGEAFASAAIDLTDLGPGVYEITTIDDFTCSRSLSFEVKEYPELVINPTMIQNECFGDSDGNIEINPFGGYLGTNLNYTVRWFKNGDVVGSQNNLTSYGNLEDATYRIEVSDSIGCKIDSVITLKAPDPISAVVNEGDIKCKGDKNGYIALDISGGTAPYIILWKEDNAFGQVVSTEDSIFNLSPGDYYVTVEDQNDCTPFTATYTITEPPTEFDASLNPTEIQCIDDRNGKIEVELEKGTGHPNSYTLLWFKDDALLSSQTDVAESEITPIENLGKGLYRLEITDSYGCERVKAYELINPTQIYFRPEIDSVTCNGFDDGSITIDPVGGYGEFSVSWASEEEGTLLDTDFELADIKAGKYTITLTDLKGCEIDTTIFISDPQPIVVTPTITNPKCVGGENGAITIEVANGTSPYFYQWSKDGLLVSTEKDISELTAGTYALSITDQFQCEYSGEVVVEDPPSEYTIEGEVSKVVCRDELNGGIDITIAITGNPNLDYFVFWEKNGVLFSQNTEDLSGIGAGTYEIFVEDQYGCEKSRTFVIENPAELAVSFLVNDVACFEGSDGSVSAQVSGGYGNYTFEWKKDLVAFDVTGSFANNLEAGFYQVTISDLEGCTLTRTVEVDEPDPFVISIESKNNICATPYDSEINATVSGGVPPYKLQWLKDGLPYSKEEDLAGIPASVYQLNAVDTNFCETQSIEVTITAPEPLGINIIELDENLCPNTMNGALSIQGTGGSFPYTYAFDSSATYESINNFVNLEGKTYGVSVKDNVGCTYDTAISIGNQYELEAEFSLTTDEFAIDFPIAFRDESLGEEIVNYLWEFGDTRAAETPDVTITYTTPGTYVVELTVENVVGCTVSKVDTLLIERGFNFTVPTAFTPNGDSDNDNFRPGFQNIIALEMKIQDRNGLVVFESSNISASWDGTFNGNDVPQGVYFYEIVYTPKSGVRRSTAGKIMVLR